MEFLQENETRQNSFSRVCLASSFLSSWKAVQVKKGKKKGKKGRGQVLSSEDRDPKAIYVCGWRDLNSHELNHWILSPARLPITPHPLLFFFIKFTIVNKNENCQKIYNKKYIT